MADAEEAHGVIVNGEQDAVIANAEAKPSAEVALERDDIPGAGARKRRMPSKMRPSLEKPSAEEASSKIFTVDARFCSYMTS